MDERKLCEEEKKKAWRREQKKLTMRKAQAKPTCIGGEAKERPKLLLQEEGKRPAQNYQRFNNKGTK